MKTSINDFTINNFEDINRQWKLLTGNCTTRWSNISDATVWKLKGRFVFFQFETVTQRKEYFCISTLARLFIAYFFLHNTSLYIAMLRCIISGDDGSLSFFLLGNTTDWSEYTGEYRCKASNGYSEDVTAVRLDIDGPITLIAERMY